MPMLMPMPMPMLMPRCQCRDFQMALIFELILISCKNSNGEWYIINSKVKVEISDVAISKSLWLLEKIILIYGMLESITLFSGEESIATCQRKSTFVGFFSRLVSRRNSRRNNEERLDQL